jgi:tetratricopeptide (TPR) repeat protein
LEALHEQLEDRLRLLVHGATDFPPRQRTMRNTLEWSHDLLTPEEQILFRRLSVFAGSWDLEAIEPVCRGGEGTVEVLSNLLDKSLIYLSADGRAARYDMLDVVREYGAERLSKAGETGAFSDRHAEHYLALAEEAETRLVTGDQKHWILQLEQEHNNLRKALGWVIEAGDIERALRFVVALWRYWRHSGQLIEGRRWCESAIELPGNSPPSLRAKAYWATAALAFPQGDYRRMSELSSRGLDHALESGDPMDLRNAHTIAGLVALVEGRYEDALRPFHRALSFCRYLGQSWQLATSHLNLGLALLHSGDLNSAESALGDGLRIYNELGDRTFAARARVALSHVALARRNFPEAGALARAALSAFASTHERQGLAEALVTIAAIRAAAGEVEIAAELHGSAAALRETIAARPAPFDDEVPNLFLDKAREESSSTWEAAASRGRGLGVEAAVKKGLGEQGPSEHDTKISGHPIRGVGELESWLRESS